MKAVIDRLNLVTKVPDYKNIIKSGKPFEDKSFRSIFSKNKSKFAPEKKKEWAKRIKWKRLSDLYSQDDLTVVDKIRPYDVEQGQIGDWYFMSTLSSLAQQQPYEIEKLFITTESNTSGWYAMRLLVNGWYQTIVVDDFIPFDPKSKRPLFAGKKTKNIWPMLLEKAWAKINGSYEDIVTGSSSEALNFLMPYPIIRLKEIEEEKIDKWEYIKDALKGKYLVTWTSKGNEPEETVDINDEIGLTENHWYSITGQFVLQADGKSKKVLRISNPWNRQQWKGKWCDTDKNWTARNKSIVKYDRKTKGEFFIGFEDYLKYFDSTTICKSDPYYDQSTLKLKHSKGSHCLIKIDVPVKTHLVIRVSQIMTRLFPEKVKYKPAFMRIILGKFTNDPKRPIAYVQGGFKTYSDMIWIETEGLVEKGKYWAYIELDWNNDLINCFSLWALGYKISIAEIDAKEYPSFLKHCIKDYAKYKLEKYRTKDNEPNFKAKNYLGELTAGYGFHYFQNYSENDTTVIDNVKYTQIEGIKFEKDITKFLVEIPPNTSKIILFKRISNSWSTNYSYNTYLKHTAKYLAKQTLRIGKKCAIESRDIKQTNMWYYYMGHDFGYTFVFVNDSKDLSVDEYITFETLENLQLTNSDKQFSKNQPFWKFTVKPGSKVVKHLRKVTIDAGFCMNYKLSHQFLKPGETPMTLKERHSPESLTDDDLTNILKSRGEPQSFKCPITGKQLKISYRHIFFKTYYAWLFENEEESKTFKGSFKFKLNNLKLDHEDQPDSWDILIKPGCKFIKKMHVDSDEGDISFSVSISYSIKDVD